MAKKKSNPVEGSEILLTDDEQVYGNAFEEFAASDGNAGSSGNELELNNFEDAGTAGTAAATEIINDDTNKGTDGTSAPIVPQVVTPEPSAEWEKEKAAMAKRLEAAEAENKRLKETPPQPEPSKKKSKKDVPDEDDEDPLANLTEDVKNELKEYEEEFAAISKFEKVKRDAEYKKLERRFSRMLDEALEKINSVVGQVSEFATEYSREKHRAYIMTKHSDFDELVESGKVEKWIATQPAEIRDVYQKWYDEGTTKQVVSLFDIYKEKTKQPEKPPEPAPKKVEKEERKKDMEVVPSRTVPVAQNLDSKKSYEDSFDEFASVGVGKK